MKTITTGFFAALLWILFPFIVSAQPRGTGLKFDLKLYNKAETADLKGLGFTGTLPASVSYKSYAPNVKDQGQTSTCVGWSTTYGALTIEYAKNMGITDKSRITAKAFCPYFTYNQLRNPDDYSCQVGTLIYNALAALRTAGAKRYFLPVFECGTKIDEEALRNSKPFRIKSFKKLFDYPFETQEWSEENFYKMDIDKVTPVKQALASGHAVPFGMKIPESFYYVMGTDLWEPTAAEISSIPNLHTDGHAMVVVGYDDSKYGGAFEVMNSWSENWGNAGYFWIKYADFKRFVLDAYYVELFDENAGTKGCVTGDCSGLYSRIIYDNGDEYEGNFKNGKKDGYGLYLWADGYVYAGQWKEDKRHGLGTSIAPGGQPYTEYWDNDAVSLYAVDNGNTSADPGCKSGDCDNGWGTYEYDNGTYVGSFTDLMRNGFGTYTFNSGGKVAGTWVDDQMDGFGKLNYTDGWTYVGEFMFDLQDGYGLEYGVDGFITGVWFMGVLLEDDGLGFGAGLKSSDKSNVDMSKMKPKMGAGTGCQSGNCTNGFGVMKYDTGDTYEGYFKDGYRDGYGNYTWASGDKYEGQWLAGNMDGVGKIVFTNGAYFIGEFRKGLQDGYGLEIAGSTFTAGVWEFGVYKPGKTILGFSEMNSKRGAKDFNLNKQIEVGPASEKTLKAVSAKKVVTK